MASSFNSPDDPRGDRRTDPARAKKWRPALYPPKKLSQPSPWEIDPPWDDDEDDDFEQNPLATDLWLTDDWDQEPEPEPEPRDFAPLPEDQYD